MGVALSGLVIPRFGFRVERIRFVSFKIIWILWVTLTVAGCKSGGNQVVKNEDPSFSSYSNSQICAKAVEQPFYGDGIRWESRYDYLPFVFEAAKRGLRCDPRLSNPPMSESESLSLTSTVALCELKATETWTLAQKNEFERRNIDCPTSLVSLSKDISDQYLCALALSPDGKWASDAGTFVKAAKSRGLDCEVTFRLQGANKEQTIATNNEEASGDKQNRTNEIVCSRASRGFVDYIKEAERRGLSCGALPIVDLQRHTDGIVCARAKSGSEGYTIEAQRRGLKCISSEAIEVVQLEISAKDLCEKAIDSSTMEWSEALDNSEYVLEAKRRGYSCGVLSERPLWDLCMSAYLSQRSDDKRDQTEVIWREILRRGVVSSCEKNYGHDYSEIKKYLASIPEKEELGKGTAVVRETIGILEAEELERLRERLEQLEAQSRETEQIIARDSQVPVVDILGKYSKDATGFIEGRVSDNVGVVELLVNDQTIAFGTDGRFAHQEYLPSGGKEFTFVVIDRAGLKSTETVRLNREAPKQVAKVSFDSLNPTNRRVKANNNALALIVGVSEYSLTAPAEFADNDAQVFYDYANLKLGIPKDRIQTLLNDQANEVGLLTGVNKWLKRSVKQGESDVYIFFAGHGLASDDGDTAYLIPYDGAPDFLERTAISRDEVFREVSSVNPRSVTVFLDTCYSGDTRGESRLIAGRPLSIKLQEQSLPKGFTVLTAAAGDQIAKPLKEAKHGLFSYYLMKGMEGDADSNNDNRITAQELHAYVRENVVQQSGGSQVPELQGEVERVLVRFQ